MRRDPDAPSWLVRVIASVLESDVRSTILRSAAMVALACGLFALGAAFLFGGSGLWKALVLLAVVLVLRAAWDLYELDAALAASMAGSLVFGAMAFGAAANQSDLPSGDASLLGRMIAFAVVSALLALVALWRARLALRAEQADASARRSENVDGS